MTLEHQGKSSGSSFCCNQTADHNASLLGGTGGAVRPHLSPATSRHLDGEASGEGLWLTGYCQARRLHEQSLEKRKEGEKHKDWRSRGGEVGRGEQGYTAIVRTPYLVKTTVD